MTEWYSGPYAVMKDIDSLAKKPRPGRGDIIAHASGAVVLRCPKCAAIQFARANILNSPKTPTLDRPIQCGSGHCKRCGVWFTIRNGVAEEAKAPERPKRTLPESLVNAGVKPPPKLDVKFTG